MVIVTECLPRRLARSFSLVSFAAITAKPQQATTQCYQQQGGRFGHSADGRAVAWRNGATAVVHIAVNRSVSRDQTVLHIDQSTIARDKIVADGHFARPQLVERIATQVQDIVEAKRMTTGYDGLCIGN